MGAGLYMYDVVLKKFTFAISSPDEFLYRVPVNLIVTAHFHSMQLFPAHGAILLIIELAPAMNWKMKMKMKLHNPHQSAYCKHHSTETALLYIYNHLVNAIGSQKLSFLCLLNLSAAFDTIDHSVLLTRFSSWFGVYGSVLN